MEKQNRNPLPLADMRVCTHSGQAHADEVLAIALIALMEGYDSVRMTRDGWSEGLRSRLAGQEGQKGGLLPPVLWVYRVNDCLAREMTEPVCNACKKYPPPRNFSGESDIFCGCEGGPVLKEKMTQSGLPPFDFVLDIGRACDARKGWFDHHQMERDAKACCTFTLLAVKKYKIDLSPFLWAEKLAVIDSKGPGEWYFRTHGQPAPSGREMARANGAGSCLFTYIANLANEDYEEAVLFARDWLRSEFEAREQFEVATKKALKTVKIVELGEHSGGPARMAFFDQRDPQGTLAVAESLRYDDDAIIVAGMLDDRGDGFGAFQLDKSRVDFAAREGEEGCVFAHKGGFLLKWAKDWDGFVAAVQRSIDEQADFEKAVEEFEEEDGDLGESDE